jgi:nucleoside 2-deoxyribosyltransferase
MRYAITNKKLYLAGPFFTPKQLDNQLMVEMMCHAEGIEFFSPRLETLTLTKDTDIFMKDLEGIDSCGAVLACVDNADGGLEPDSGTAWECGYAYANSIPVFVYSLEPNKVMNLMITTPALGYFADEQVNEFLKLWKIVDTYLDEPNMFSSYKWEGTSQ